jgi:hypothetical protein
MEEPEEPCHEEITILSKNVNFCPICGFYYPKNDA